MEAYNLEQNCLIVESSLNYVSNSTNKYKEAARYLRQQPIMTWIYIDDLPNWLATPIIDLIDNDSWNDERRGIKKVSEFNETYTAFRIKTVKT